MHLLNHAIQGKRMLNSTCFEALARSVRRLCILLDCTPHTRGLELHAWVIAPAHDKLSVKMRMTLLGKPCHALHNHWAHVQEAIRTLSTCRHVLRSGQLTCNMIVAALACMRDVSEQCHTCILQWHIMCNMDLAPQDLHACKADING